MACLLVSLLSFSACDLFRSKSPKNETAILPDSLANETGKRLFHLVLDPPDSIGPLVFHPTFSGGLMQQTLYLLRTATPERPVKGVSKEALVSSIHLLQNWPDLTPAKLYEIFDFYQLQTNHSKDQVRVTGYYTPTIPVQKKKSSKYAYPLLKRPRNWKGPIPSSSAIYQGELNGKGLEIAWCTSMQTVKNAQLQGSCIIEYPDGKKRFLGYDGTNKTMLKTQSDTSEMEQTPADLGKAYVFFQERDSVAWGAAGFPLAKDHSLAVDPRVIPIGSCLLARLPIRDSLGVKRDAYQIVLAQDMGAAIRTTAHVDLYCGIGKEGLDRVKSINGYGQFWLLLPKEKKVYEK